MPMEKWSALLSGAENIKSQIYMYRARVGDYTPRVKNNLDVLTKVWRCDLFSSALFFHGE